MYDRTERADTIGVQAYDGYVDTRTRDSFRRAFARLVHRTCEKGFPRVYKHAFDRYGRSKKKHLCAAQVED